MGRRFASFAMRRQVRDHAGRGGSPLGPLTNRLALHLQSDFGVTAISGKVSEWAGQEGYRNTVVQAVDANRPMLVPAVLDGHPAIRFNGSQWLQALAQVGVVAGDTPRMYVVGSFAATGTSYAGTLASYDNTAVINRGFLLYHNITDQGFNVLRGGSLRQIAVAIALGNNSIPHLFDGRNDPTACVLAISGIDRGSFPATAAGLDFTPDNINIGRLPSGILPLTGDIFCVIVVNNETASSHATIMNYLKATYPSLPLSWPQTPPLPASAVEYWHSELACTPAAWVGQLRGTVLTGNGSPTVGADGTYFNGRNVARTFESPSGFWRSAAVPALVATGQLPWMMVVGRFRNADAGDIAAVSTTGSNSASFYLEMNGLGRCFSGVDGAVPVYNDIPVDLLPHRMKTWRDGTNAHFMVDGTDSVVARAGPITLDLTVVAIGTNAQALTQRADSSVAFAILCSSKPTAAEEAALDAWAQAYWGVP